MGSMYAGLLVAVVSLLASAVRGQLVPNRGYVIVQNGSFYLNCRRFIFSGSNSWDLMQNASNPNTIGTVNATLDDMVSMNLSVVRTWGFSTQASSPVQLRPGVYNQTLLRGLDFVLAQARLRGVRVLIAFSNFWGMGDGVNKYIKWAGLNHTDLFFNSSRCQVLYKNYMSMLVSRVNTYNGIRYLNDTTILGWNLLNEPRCFTDGCQDSLQSWTELMSTYLKGIDPNHLVSTGYEGFYGAGQNHTSSNPGEPWGHWATQTGQEFIRNNRFWAIDFAVAHIWSENWIGNQQNTSSKLSFIQGWIEAHNQDAHDVLRKPLVWEEFGMQDITFNRTFTSRDVFLTAIYNTLYSSLINNGTVQGDNVWVFKSPDGEYGYTIRPGQSAANVVKAHASAVMQYKYSFGQPC